MKTDKIKTYCLGEGCEIKGSCTRYLECKPNNKEQMRFSHTPYNFMKKKCEFYEKENEDVADNIHISE